MRRCFGRYGFHI